MNLLLFAQWRLRLAELEDELFQTSANVSLKILLNILVNNNVLERKLLLSNFSLDRVTMRWHINSLVEDELIVVSENTTDRRRKDYSITPRGILLLREYRNEVIKRTFLYSE